MPSVGDIMAGRAFVLLYAHDTPLYRGLQMAERRVQQFAYTANRIGRSMLTVATAAGLPLAYSAKTFADFQDQMLAVQAKTRGTREEFERLYEQAKKLGATTSFTASQVAGGQVNLATQGFSSAEIEASIPHVLNLARATGTDLALAANIASGALRAFGLEASEMPRVVDVMVATANNSSQTLEDLGESMAYAAKLSKDYGLSIEQTAKALGVLANLQIKGSMAGTALRQIMLRLVDTGVQEKLRGMNIEVKNLTGGSLRPLGDVMAEIGKKMATMGQAERLSLAKDLFDQRAVSASLSLATQDFDRLSEAIENAAGVAQQSSDTMDSGLGGVLRILMSAVEGVQIAIGEALQEKLRQWGTSATELAGIVQKWIEVNRDLIVTVAKIVAGLAAFGVAAIAVGSVAGSIAATINLVSMAVAGLSTAFTFMLANPAVLAIAALTAGLMALGYALDQSATEMMRLATYKQELVGKSDQLRAADMELMRELAALSNQQGLSNEQMDRAGSIIEQLEERYGDLGLEMNKTTGEITGVASAFDLLTAAMARNAESEIRSAMLEAGANVQSLNDDLQRIQGEWMTPWGKRSAILDIERQRDAEYNNMKALEARYRALKAGNAGAVFGSPESPVTDPATAQRTITEQLAAGQVTSDEALKMNEEMQDRISEYRIQRMKDEQDRIIAEINRRYEAERKKAEELGASLSLVEEARKAALATADERYRQRKEEEKKRQQEAAAVSNQRMRDEIARIEIEKQSGDEIDKAKAAGASLAQIKALELERDKKLLELDRQRELQQARKEGIDPAIVNELYDARLAMAEQQARQDRFAEIRQGRRALREAALAPTAAVGSIEAYQAFARNASSDPAQRIREKSLRELVDIRQNTQRAADAAEEDGFEEVGID